MVCHDIDYSGVVVLGFYFVFIIQLNKLPELGSHLQSCFELCSNFFLTFFFFQCHNLAIIILAVLIVLGLRFCTLQAFFTFLANGTFCQ